MNLRNILIFILLLALQHFAGAQVIMREKNLNAGKSGSLMRSGGEKMYGNIIDYNSINMDYGKFKDDKFKEQDEQMRERDWLNEDTAWGRASFLDTKEAYERYIVLFPNGEHRPQATKRLVDLDVDSIFNKDHDGLPGFKIIEKDDDSPTSMVDVHNKTDFILTVMYSGMDSKSVMIPPGGTASVTVTNGRYRIAASVSAAYVRPYAGSELLAGGRYEVSFYVVSY